MKHDHNKSFLILPTLLPGNNSQQRNKIVFSLFSFFSVKRDRKFLLKISSVEIIFFALKLLLLDGKKKNAFIETQRSLRFLSLLKYVLVLYVEVVKIESHCYWHICRLHPNRAHRFFHFIGQ